MRGYLTSVQRSAITSVRQSWNGFQTTPLRFAVSCPGCLHQSLCILSYRVRCRFSAIRDHADSWQRFLWASRGGGRDRAERFRQDRRQELMIQVLYSYGLVPRHAMGPSHRPRMVLAIGSAQIVETAGALPAHCAGEALPASRWATPLHPPWVHFSGISPPAFLHPHSVCDRSRTLSQDGRAALSTGSIIRGTLRHTIITGLGPHSAGPSGNGIRDFFSSVGYCEEGHYPPSAVFPEARG